jgi:hypothetical protein
MTTVRRDMVIDISATNNASDTIASLAQDAVDALEKVSAARKQAVTQTAQADAQQAQANAKARDAMAEFAKLQRKDMAVNSLKEANQQIADVAKVTKVIGALSLAAEGVNVALGAGRVAMALWSGDAKKASDAVSAWDAAMRSLPLGFNRIYGMGSSVGEMVFGDKADAERINAQAESIKKAYDDLAESAKKYRDAAAEAAKRQVDLLREGEKLRNPDRAGVLDVKNETEDRIKAARAAADKELLAAQELAKKKSEAVEATTPREQLAKDIAEAQRVLKIREAMDEGGESGQLKATLVAEARTRLEALQSSAASRQAALLTIERNLEVERARIAAASAAELAQINENARLKEQSAMKEAAEKAAAIEKEKARALRDLQDQTARQLGQARSAADVAALKDQGKFLDAELLQAQNNYREKIRALNAEMDGRRAANPELEAQITQAQLSREAALAQERDAVMARAREENAKKEAEFAGRRDNMLIDSQSKLIEKQKELEGDSVAARLEANKRVYDQMREQAIAAFKDRNDPASRAALNQLMNNYAASQKADAEKIALEERTAQAKGIRQGGFAATLLDNSFMDLAGRNNPMLTELKATSESNKKQAASLEKMVNLTEQLLAKFGASEGPQLSSGFGLGGNS